jgi:hypothetical protein
MDPISAISLLGVCAAIAGRVASTVMAMNGLVSDLRNADRSISRLAAQLSLFNATIEQLHEWLGRAAALSQNLQRTLHLALAACSDIVSDIEEYVAKVQPRPGEQAAGLADRLRYIWNEKMIVEQERRLATQFQALDLFIRLLQL